MNVDAIWLLGQTVNSVKGDHYEWKFVFSDGSVLRAECPWRIIANQGIALGSSDHKQRFGLPEPVDGAKEASFLLEDLEVTNVSIHSETSDLVIQFPTGTRLELFNGSSGYEGWNLTASDGKSLIAMGGGELVSFGMSPS